MNVITYILLSVYMHTVAKRKKKEKRKKASRRLFKHGYAYVAFMWL